MSQSQSNDFLLQAVQEAQSRSADYQNALRKIQASDDSQPEIQRAAIRELSKIKATADEICPGCGHERRHHLWGSGNCLCHVPLGGGNPGSTYCRCAAFGDGLASDPPVFLKSSVADKRDNRDPSSEEMDDVTYMAISEIRERRGEFDTL